MRHYFLAVFRSFRSWFRAVGAVRFFLDPGIRSKLQGAGHETSGIEGHCFGPCFACLGVGICRAACPK